MARIEPGSIVEHDGERSVVVDVIDDDLGCLAVLRYTDDDPRRELDDEGGDIGLIAKAATEVTVVGRIDD